MEALTILILEDEPIIAMDLKEYCIELGHQVVSVSYSYEQALIELETKHPNFALVDIRIGHQDSGIEFGKKLSEDYGVPFVFITSFFDEKTLDQAKETFPTGYLVKPISQGGLSAAIQVGVANFLKWRPNGEKQIDKLKKSSIAELTSRELEVIQHLMNGKTNYEISQAQYVSVNTIKTHLKNIYIKLNVKSRGQLIALLNN
ncbi:DNA-binding response regulator [Flavobacterium lacus]|uniref:DNA-binding NarL/FixJ family response regulator n=1 Tax=Flavobacterium lacus TaxID=1353778 RepID=A0A328WRC8_9FLAO|nr:DNA-binding response regulator [Flavobacterium lacus]RAR48900.1 DNA-binding NarL/FixJ family response regulator [Flavobacterium lacus]